MRIIIVAVGRVQKGPERELVARYVERIGQVSPSIGIKFSVTEVPQSRLGRPADRMADEAKSIEEAIPKGARRIALDERGRSVSSADFAARIGQWRDDGVADTALVIGGADGLASDVVERSDWVLALGKMSWPHQLVRGMLAEQVYRAMTILSGHPYHRA